MSFLERINNIEKNEIENNFILLNILEDIVSKSIENLSNNEYIISELIIKKLYNYSINICIEQFANNKNIRLTCNQVSAIVLIDNNKLSFDALSHVIDILHKNTKNIIEKYLHKYFAGMNIKFHKLKDWSEYHRLVYEYTISK